MRIGNKSNRYDKASTDSINMTTFICYCGILIGFKAD